MIIIRINKRERRWWPITDTHRLIVKDFLGRPLVKTNLVTLYTQAQHI